MKVIVLERGEAESVSSLCGIRDVELGILAYDWELGGDSSKNQDFELGFGCRTLNNAGVRQRYCSLHASDLLFLSS